MAYVEKIYNRNLNQDADVLKQKVIAEFMQLLKKVKKGYKPDYEFIL